MKYRRFPKELEDFFLNAVRETIEEREKNNIRRNDFMDLIIQLKNKGYVEGADADDDDGKESNLQTTHVLT